MGANLVRASEKVIAEVQSPQDDETHNHTMQFARPFRRLPDNLLTKGGRILQTGESHDDEYKNMFPSRWSSGTG